MSSIVKAGLMSVILLAIFGAGFFIFFKSDEGGPPEPAPGPQVKGAHTAPREAKIPKPTLPHSVAGEVTFTVRILDENTKKILPRSSLLVQKITDGDRPGEKVFESGRRSAATNTGEWQVPVEPGVYQVRGQCSGYSSRMERVTVLKDQAPLVVTLELDRGLSISGRVLSKDGQRGIGGARVMAYPQIGNPRDNLIERLINMPQITENAQKPPAETVSADDGSYQIDGLEKKYYTVKAVAPAFTPQERPEIAPTKDNVNFQLSPGGRLCGEVVDNAGGAVSGAKVMAFSHVDSSDLFSIIETRSRPPFETVETGAGGEFCFETLGSGTYNFVAAKKGYQEARFLKIRVREEDNPRQHFTLARGLTIAGTVVSAGNEPVAGAKVRATRVGDTGQREQYFIKFDDGSISTDEQGHFQFDTLEQGKYTILASHRDHASEQRRDIDAGTEDLTITLPAGGAVQGLVTEAGTRTPIAGARISVNDMQDLRKEGITDALGFYYIGGLNATGQGSRYMNIHAEGYARISNLQIHVEDGRVNDNQDFELQRTASVTGRVVNSEGQGVSGARVMAKRKGPNSQVPLTVGSAVTREDGGYLIKELEAGDETVLSVLQTSGYLDTESAQPFPIQPGESKQVEDIVLQMGGMVKGVVVGPDGRGMAGVQVSVKKEGETAPDVTLSASSEAGGQFLLQGLPAGTVDLVARSTHHIEEVVTGVTVAEGRITPNVKIVLRQGGRVAGQVVDASGTPIREAKVVARDVSASGGLKELEAESDPDGRFALENVLSTDSIELEVDHAEYGAWSSEKVKVNADDLKVVLQKLGGVRAEVVDAAGNPVPSFSVQPQPKDPESSSRKRLAAKTFQKGAFEFAGIPPGTYDINVSAPGFSAHTSQNVTVGGSVESLGRITLQEGGIVNGVVVDGPSDRPLPGATVRVLGGMGRFNQVSSRPAGGDVSMVVTDQRGFFEFRGLKPGAVSLNVIAKGYVTQRRDDVDPSVAVKSRDIRIELDPGAEIVGSVTDTSGNAKNGVQVYLMAVGELANQADSNQRTATNSEGRFQFQGLSAGRYRVTAQRLGGDPGTNVSEDVAIDAGFRQEVELTFPEE